MLLLYNTLGRKKQKFETIKPKSVGMYACGPTVYSAPHIGNFRAYLEQDILKRALMHDGYKVNHVVNITDVGHLVGDANLGEDKVKLAAEREHKTAREVADFYTAEFMKDMHSLNIIVPDAMPKATDHIKEMLNLIEILDEKGYLYKVPTGIYFDTSKFKEYGKLAKMTFDKLNKYLKAGARVERAAGLKNITDFAVWRFRKRESKDEMIWESKWGEGFPGWHIECSAMSMKYLGETFDLHCGGIDHIPIHHTNEIAQSEAATGKKFVNYWVHNNFLTVDGGKMAKSVGNVYTITQLVEKGYSPIAVRYTLISAHYRKKLNFTLEALANSSKTLNGIYSFLQRLSVFDGSARPSKEFEILAQEEHSKFFKAISNDLNVPSALSAMHNLITETNRKIEQDLLSKSEAKLVLGMMLEFDQILGLEFEKNSKQDKKQIKGAIEKLIQEREDARKSKDFKRSDEIRDLLKNKFKIIIEDTKDGVRWHKEV
ncbi:MAG: cysteine--tRNA ligase [Candidatus Micrarchaeota archaeon]|nr:cysteine--tRNA ligase [Candidatus Micrarchaeota archaeon]